MFPATNAVGERWVSAMRYIKNWLLSIMLQERLNHCMLLSIHKESTGEINFKMYFVKVMNKENVPLVSSVFFTSEHLGGLMK